MRSRRLEGEHLSRSQLRHFGSLVHTAPLRAMMNNVFFSSPPSMQAKQPRSTAMVSSTSPPSRTRTHRLLGTSAHQTAPSASMQIPSGTASLRSAHTRRFDRLPSSAMSKAVGLLPWDSATINVPLSGVNRHTVGEREPLSHLGRRAIGTQ
jgi:hypothetical protein